MRNVCTKQDLWLVRAYYFILFGAFGFTIPFLNLYYDRLGIPATQIGFFVTINALVALVASPSIGAYAGKSSNQSRIIQIGLIFSAVIITLIGFSKNAIMIGLLVGLNGITIAAVYPTSISLAQSIANFAPGNQGFGSIRLYGSVGWAIVTYAAGLAIERFGISVIFFGYVIFLSIGAWLIGCIRVQGDQLEDDPSTTKLRTVLAGTIKDKSLVGFGVMVVISYGAMIGVRQFEVLYMDKLGAPESVIGLAYTIAAVAEIPFMLLADRLIDRVNSTNVLRLGLFLDLTRLVLVWLFPTIPIILIGRAISGVAYAFYTVALVQFVLERARAGQNIALQAVYNVTLPNLISIIASPIIGRVFDQEGGYAMYSIGIWGMLIAMVLFISTVSGKRSRLREPEASN
jgi:PPP family 3-phenylpropionic acid transporter